MISLQAIGKTFSGGGQITSVLKGIDLVIKAGEAVCILGPSGSGKSTLLNIIGTLSRPTHGTYHLAGRETTTLGDFALSAIRRKYFGFIFQKFNLLWESTAFQNVELPLKYSGVPKWPRIDKTTAALEAVGLSGRRHHKAFQLSGGEQQRVAIARAFINEPEVILADEPTGNLDSELSRVVIDMLFDYWRRGRGLVLITHNLSIARRFPRILEVVDGRLVDHGAKGQPPTSP